PEDSDAQVYAYVAKGAIHTEAPAGSHVHLYDFVSSAAVPFGAAESTPYESLANVAGCEKCHGKPYMKHGYRQAQVEGLGDFASCKSCHYDTRTGGHEDWQILVDDPLRYSEIHAGAELTTEEETKYAYTANLMNDVHMAHAMEFPYPQRMSNCVTCHEGKLDKVLVDENFTAATCKSCHAPTGNEKYGTAEHSLKTIWENAGVDSMHSIDADCASCHKADGVGKKVLFKDLHHGGYDPMIYSADGTRYADALKVAIVSASFDSDTKVLTTKIKVTEEVEVDEVDATDVVPDVRAAVYAWEAKDFYDYESGEEINDGGGNWTSTVDLSGYTADMDSGKLRRVEIVVRPGVSMAVGEPDVDDGTCGESCGRHTHCEKTECVDDDDVGLAPVAPSRSFDLDANEFDDGFFEDIVDVNKCNSCHDTLATTFHSPNRSGNINVCRMCHNPTKAGSHLEMQSRSLDSYIHAIHSFQPFDPGDVNLDDPVEAMRLDMHTKHRFPNFTIKNCEACHNEGKYEVPDQSHTTAGVLSGADDVANRDIKGVASVIVGPGARTCGACHRAMYIRDDDFNGLVSFNQHTKLNGYAVKAESGTWDGVMNTVMWYFGEETEPGADVGPETCAVCHKGQGAEHQLVYDDYIDPN
ncbi:MAG: OmcA/MtrC family decaheme c-type cytochrome, partial [Kiritimatiellia bacterium]